MRNREEAMMRLIADINAAEIVSHIEDGTLRQWIESWRETTQIALSALRPVSREQVEKAWPECDCCEIPCDNCKSAYKWDTHGLADECVVCRENGYKNYTPESQFCEFCGRPLTDEAVEMVMERLEALNEED